jgi:hypothetical protein
MQLNITSRQGGSMRTVLALQQINLSRIFPCVLLLTKYVLVVIAIGWACSASAQDVSIRKAEIVKLLQGIKLEQAFGAKDPFCQAFLDDFRQQKNIEHIAPIVQTEDYNDPRLAPYKGKCPKLDFHKSRQPVGAAPHKIQLSPERMKEIEENDNNYTIYLDTRNLQLYELEMDDNPANGKEIVFYGESPRVVSSGGIPQPDGPIYNAHRGLYRVISFDGCSEIGGMSVGQLWGPSGGPTESHGVIRYRGKYALYDLTVFEVLKYADGSLHGPVATLLLNNWNKGYGGTYGVGQACVFDTPRK